jgi:hypothetical protein
MTLLKRGRITLRPSCCEFIIADQEFASARRISGNCSVAGDAPSSVTTIPQTSQG